MTCLLKVRLVKYTLSSSYPTQGDAAIDMTFLGILERGRLLFLVEPHKVITVPVPSLRLKTTNNKLNPP